MRFDKFHEKDDRLYQIMEVQNNATESKVTKVTPGLLAEAIADEISGVEYTTAISWPSTFTIVNNEKELNAEGIFAGTDFFNVFSFPLLEGNKDQVLTEINNVVIY